MTDNFAFKIERNDTVGRYAVASQLLRPGDVIFSEFPFAYGPKGDSPPCCLGCYMPVDCSIRCSTCCWPVCSQECEKIPVHRDGECIIFAKAQALFQAPPNPNDTCLQYECITPLRVLLAKQANEARWKEEVGVMESHNAIRKSKPIWNFNQVNIVGYLRGPCKVGEQFSEELIHTVCGILESNAFEARTVSGYLIRCLYPKLAIMSHNCVSNILHCIQPKGEENGNDFNVTVRASTEVKKGEELFSSYTYSLWPTLVRREFLNESKFFDCKCARCSDPKELGTHMSTIKCTKCDNGVVLSTSPLDSAAMWKCSHCEFFASGMAIRTVFSAIQADVDRVEEVQDASGIEAREALARKYRSVLHPNNAYQTMLRVSLSQMYGKVDGYTMDILPDILLERKVELCNQLLEVLDVVEPGYSRIRGITLYELHAPLILLARNLYRTDSISEEVFRKKMEEAMCILEEAATILSLEPLSTVEGSLGQMARKSLLELKDNLETIIENV